MHVNENTALLTPRLLLVPYCRHHVATYHEWMRDESLRASTASEPLTLDQEHAMQTSWHHDPDKLTFILCLPTPNTTTTIQEPLLPTVHDPPHAMIGDINLFLLPDTETQLHPDLPSDPAAPRYLVAEIELMIATPGHRRRGLGRDAVRTLIWYLGRVRGQVLREYYYHNYARGRGRGRGRGRSGSETGAGAGQGHHHRGGRHDGQEREEVEEEEEEPEVELSYLRVKIGEGNAPSLALFESMGFRRVGGVSYFGEVELRRNLDWMGDGAGADVRVLRYERGGGEEGKEEEGPVVAVNGTH